MQEYMSNAKEGSSWVMSHPDSTNGSLSFHALEAGKFIMGATDPGVRLGKSGYLLVYTCAGDGDLLYLGRQHKLPKLTMVLIDCKNGYDLKHARSSSGDWIYYWLRFEGANTAFFYDTLYNEDFFALETDSLKVQEVYECMIEDIFSPGVDSRFRISHGISTLLTYLVESSLSQSPRRYRHMHTIGKATQYIRENYSKQLDINQLSSQASLSKYYFIKLFKEFMHVAPYEYVIIHRINEAKKYLRATHLKISQISDRVGFNDECNFIRTFKRVTGITPLQFRDTERK